MIAPFIKFNISVARNIFILKFVSWTLINVSE